MAEIFNFEKHTGFGLPNWGEGLECKQDNGKQVCQIINPKQVKSKKLISQGTVNVYEINGKAYYEDIVKGNFIRAPERDSLIKGKEDCSCPFKK